MKDFLHDLLRDWEHHLPSRRGVLAGVVFLLAVPAALWLHWEMGGGIRPWWQRPLLLALVAASVTAWAVGLQDSAARRRRRAGRTARRHRGGDPA